MSRALERSRDFCKRFGLEAPILLAPMAGACPPSLSIEVAKAGGMGAAGVLTLTAAQILDWAKIFRAETSGPFQLNNWIPGPEPRRDREHEAVVRKFLATWGPEVPQEAGDQRPYDFAEQCAAMLDARPRVISSIMGVFAPEYVKKIKKQGIVWFANVTTVSEAKVAETAGADVIIAQGAEAGGHRGSFNAEDAESRMIGLMSLLPAVVDAVRVPVVAAGGIADGRGAAAALILGASAVQIGTAFLRCPEAKIHPAWADAIGRTLPEDTRVSRVFSGRAGRSISTDYVKAATAPDAPSPAPYPVQRGLTSAMRAFAQKHGDVHRMQAWAGQSAAMAECAPAGEVVKKIWSQTQGLL